MIQAGYIDCPQGQVHFRQWLPAEGETRPPILCLHPAPFSGLFFTTAMPALGRGRRVIAPDYPGYGASSPGEDEPQIEDYAVAMLRFLQALLPGERVDVLGFHTGCLVAAEMQLQSADSIGALVMVDVPYFVGATQEQMLERAANPLALNTEPESIAPLWQSGVAVKAPLMGMARSVELLSEQLRVYPRAHLAFRAAFTYPCQERFQRLPGPAAIIGTQSGLLEATRDGAAAAQESALFIEATEISRGVFEEGAPAIAARIDDALHQLKGESSD